MIEEKSLQMNPRGFEARSAMRMHYGLKQDENHKGSLAYEVVECEGWVNDHSIGRAKLFMRDFPKYEYIVVGSEMPCDTHIPWEDRKELVNYL